MQGRHFTVNRNIARVLQERGLLQSDIAPRAGMSSKVLSNIVRCKRKVYADEVVPIAKALGVSVGALFSDADAC